MLKLTPATFLRWATLYFVIGVALGNYMAAAPDFTLRPVHAHVSLLGWVSLALAGLIYKAYPAAATTRLAQAHFWIMVAGLPLLLAALAGSVLGHPELDPLLGATAMLAGVGVLLFTINVFRTVRD